LQLRVAREGTVVRQQPQLQSSCQRNELGVDLGDLGHLVVEDVEADGTTAYGIWKISKEVFEKVGLEFDMRPQTFYNYAKNGKVNGVKGQKRFSEDEVTVFVAKLVAGNMRQQVTETAETE